MTVLASPHQTDRISINTFVFGGEMINPQRGFPLTAAVIGIIIIGGALFSFFTSKERVFPKDSVEDRLTIFQSFKLTAKDYNFRWNTAFSPLYFVNNTLMISTMVYYSIYVFNNPGTTTTIMGIFAVGSILALPFIKRIERVLGRRKAMMLGAILIILSKIPFVIAPYNILAMYATVLITGLSVALNLVTFSTTRAEHRSLHLALDWFCN